MAPATQTPDYIEASRRRSVLYGLDPAKPEPPYRGSVSPAATALKRLSDPVLDRLVAQIIDSRIGVVLADRSGQVTRRDAGNRSTMTAMDKHRIDVGFSLAETDVGTNGVGTSLETRCPAVVVGDDHFLEALRPFTCANAPIFHPISRRIEGTVGVICPVEETSPLLLPTATQLSAQITRLLLERAAPEERFLLEQFLQHRRRSNDAIATMSAKVLIATPAAQRLLTGVIQSELWDHVSGVVGQGSSGRVDFIRADGRPLRLRCRPVHRAGQVDGAVVEFMSAPQPDGRAKRQRRSIGLDGLVGTSDQWCGVAHHARLAARSSEPVLIVGERGTGRLAVANAIASLAGYSDIRVLDSADTLFEGALDWITRFHEALAPETAVILRRIDHLSPDIAAALTAMVSEAPRRARIIATTESAEANEPANASLLDRLDVLRIEIPPLRHRRDDIPPIVRDLAARLGRYSIDPRIISVLYRQPWPGNVTEVHQTLRATIARAGTEDPTVSHLPLRVLRTCSRRPLHGLRQQEADAIIDALAVTAGNKKDAARLLGISRATLYRRIDSFGIDLDAITFSRAPDPGNESDEPTLGRVTPSG